MPPTVLHVSPHPDDESIGAPCTLLALRDAGWHVVNLVCSLGREADWSRRREEVENATGIAGFENVVAEEPVRLSASDNHEAARRKIIGLLGPMLADERVELVMGPHPQDGHHAHETVALAIRDALVAADRPIPWWMWGIWRDLPQPTLYARCTPAHVDESEEMIDAYRGENRRNSYRAMHRARRRVNAVLGAEQVFGFGASHRAGSKWVELLTEVSYRDAGWMAGPPRELDMPGPTTQWRWPEGVAGNRILQSLAVPPAPHPGQRKSARPAITQLIRRTGAMTMMRPR